VFSSGSDVSLVKTAILVVDRDGGVQWQGKVPSGPGPLIKRLTEWLGNIELAGIEACPLSEWLHRALREAGIPIVCIETRQAQRFLSSRPIKTDKNDARGIAGMMRLGHYRPVHVKSLATQSMRTTLAARMQLVASLLQIEGVAEGLGSQDRGNSPQSRRRAGARADRAGGTREIVGGDRAAVAGAGSDARRTESGGSHSGGLARRSDVGRRLMTIPGVGSVTTLAYIATDDDPGRFGNLKALGAHLGLTLCIYQSARSTDPDRSVSAGIECCGIFFTRPHRR